MGCNYYLVTNSCKHCHRGDEKIHLGKASAGWAFSFRGYHLSDCELPNSQAIENFEDWERFIWENGGEVQDEYGFREITQTFIDGAAARTGLHHAEQHSWKSSMVGGRSFTFAEFC